MELKCISRYDLNIAAGIIHTAKEHGATDVIIGLHWKVNIVDSFFGMLTESLLKGLHREVMVARFLIPINTLRRIIVAVPPKAEYEAGFQKWVDHFCRMGTTLGRLPEVGGPLLPHGHYAGMPRPLLCQRTDGQPASGPGQEEA